MSRARFVIIALAAGLVLTGEVRAQPEVEIAITDRGAPLSGVMISQLVDGIKTRKGTTGGSGEASFAPDALDFEDGENVSVWVRRCEDGEVEVILVAEGEDDPCVEEDAVAGEDCGCERIGAFVWGGGRVRIDVGDRRVRQERTDALGYENGYRVQLGGGLGYSRWPHLDRACELDGVVGCELSDDGVMFQALLEWYILSRIGLGLEVNYTPGLQVDHTSFESIDGFPVSNVTDLDVLGVGFLGLVRFPLGMGRHAVFAAFGPMWTVNLGDVRSDYGSLGVLEESRHDPGLRLAGRGGLDWGFGDGPWASRFEFGGMTGEEHDIDTSWFLAWKLLYRVWGAGGGL